AIGHQVRRLVRLLVEPHRDTRGVDPEEDVRVGTELLEYNDLGAYRRQFGRCERCVLERLRPDAEDDGAAHARSSSHGERDPELTDNDLVALDARLDEVHR